MKKAVFIVSNAIDDATRIERHITTDSPAASRKVFMWGNLLHSPEVETTIISLGRGRCNRSSSFFKSKVIKKGKAKVIFLPFSHVKYISEFLTFLSLPLLILSLHRRERKKEKAVIFYNRHPAYLLGLMMSFTLGLRRFIDIEDGEISENVQGIKKIIQNVIIASYDKFCAHGAILACSALDKMTTIQPTLCYYGYVQHMELIPRFSKEKIHFLLSGTISEDTGSQILYEALLDIKNNDYHWKDKAVFEISGQGDGIDKFRLLNQETKQLQLIVHGRLSNDDYHKLLLRTDVGMALKPVKGELADTTFPSKVIEYANYGILVISTDISDVRKTLGENGAYYLSSNDPQSLVRHIESIVIESDNALKCANRGMVSIQKVANPKYIYPAMIGFLFPGEKRQ